MGLFQKAFETFECHKDLAGMVDINKTPLAPIAHTVTSAQIEISLNRSGSLMDMAIRNKDDPKIIIPVTEESAGRTSGDCPHPLCDQLSYLADYNEDRHKLYMNQLRRWAFSDFGHPKLFPILKYLESGTILSDLSSRNLIKLNEDGKPKDEGLLVCWRVIGIEDNTPSACWMDISLFSSFTQYYRSLKEATESAFCMVSGSNAPVATQHAKGIIADYGNAKLISSNDRRGFTFRGRFKDETQASTMSYDASQKAHNALRWLVADQGVSFGGRTFLCWNPQGKKVASATGPFMRRSTPLIKPSDYREALHETLLGYRSELAAKDGVVIAAFDAATPGRLSVTYYNELLGSDFLDRLHDWEEYCCWINGPFGIQSPSLFQIACSAYGVQRKDKSGTKLVVDDRILRQQMQRLISCRIDKAQIPYDLVKSLVDHASSPQSYEEDQWRRILFTTCAILNKYDHDKKGMKEMDWSLDRKDRSFQFGRLLAAMERVEADYYYKTQEERQTSAIKAMSDFRQRPWNTYERINRHLLQAYIPRIDDYQRRRYAQLKDEIVTILSQFPASELNKPLSDAYLMGYDLQHAAFFEKKTNNTTTTEEE